VVAARVLLWAIYYGQCWRPHLGLLGDALALRGDAPALRLGPGRLLDLPARNGRSARVEAVGGKPWETGAAVVTAAVATAAATGVGGEWGGGDGGREGGGGDGGGDGGGGDGGGEGGGEGGGGGGERGGDGAWWWRAPRRSTQPAQRASW